MYFYSDVPLEDQLDAFALAYDYADNELENPSENLTIKSRVMEKQLVVKWDKPKDEHWFNAEGLEQILNNYFPNTVFKVKEIPVNYSMKVTEKMREAEAFVDEYIEANGRPPSYRQVAKQLNLKSPSAAYARLRRYRKFMKIK